MIQMRVGGLTGTANGMERSENTKGVHERVEEEEEWGGGWRERKKGKRRRRVPR